MRRAIAGYTVVALLLAAACAEEPDVGADGQQATAAEGSEGDTAATSVQVIFADTGFNVSAARAPTGTVLFQLRNRGDRMHAFIVRGAQEEWSSLDLSPGEELTMGVALPVGRYELLCPLTEGGAHADQGERASLEVY